MKKRNTLITLSLTSLLFSACTGAVTFSSPSALGEGVRGKYWHTSYFLDEELYSPISHTPNQLLNTFDAVASGDVLQVVATWADTSQNRHKGFARLYDDDSGWATLGPKFSTIVQVGTRDLGHATIAAGTDSFFVANFFASTASEAGSASFTGSSWVSYTSATAMTSYADYASSQDLINGPRAVSVLDAVGRGFVFYADTNSTGNVRMATWSAASAKGLDEATIDITGAAVTAQSGVTARYDGNDLVCVTYELDATKAVTATCIDTTASGAFLTNAAETISTTTSYGHESATDDDGNIMVVFYQLRGTTYSMYASLGEDGEWPASPTRIDAAMTSPYTAPSPALIAGARPGVAHVGDGKFLAVWVGVDSTSSPKSTALFSSLYKPGVGWSDAAAINGTYDAYYSTPHAQALHVFGNGKNNAGFALNKIHTDQTSILVNSAKPYPETKQVRNLQVARWHKDDGWLAVSNQGNLCYPFGSGSFPDSVGTADASCKARPTGVILPSGNSFVFFQDRDSNSGTSNAGNRRLAVTAFTP